MRSYQEMVVGPMKQMSEENQLLIWYKNKVAIDQQHEKDLEQTMELMSNQLRITNEENRIVKQRTTIQHEENKEQVIFEPAVTLINVVMLPLSMKALMIKDMG